MCCLEKWTIVRYYSRVQFNNSRFVFHDSSWSLHEPCFRWKHIFHVSYRKNITQDYGFKTKKQVFNIQIISKTFLSMISTIIYFIIKQKFCKHNFLRSRNNKLKKWDSLLFKTFTIWFTVVLEKYFVKLSGMVNCLILRNI